MAMNRQSTMTLPYPPDHFAPRVARKAVKVTRRDSAEMTEAQINELRERELVYEFDFSWTKGKLDYNWSIARNYDAMIKLQRDLIPITSKVTSELPEIAHPKQFRLLSATDRLKMLEKYLKAIVQMVDVMMNESFLAFIEVSIQSFDGLSSKHKEGYIAKRTGGRVLNERRCCNLGKYFRRFQKRWLIIRDNFIGYLTNAKGTELHESLLFKGKFIVAYGKRDTGYSDGISITTTQRQFVFRAGNEFKRDEWVDAIETAYNRSEWSGKENRFFSSFPTRQFNNAQWFVDGEGYYGEVLDSIRQAKREIFITDWWLSPELFLRRPSLIHRDTMLVEVLGELADRGIEIFVHVYKEVSLALTLNSLHTKNCLINRNPNIKVVRHPHRSVVGGEFLWSHHEKIVCIDQEVAFLGGLDLCYGRFDNREHKLVDNVEPHFWNGIDYSNSRFKDFYDVDKNQDIALIDRDECPRMPWHDIAMKVTGKVAYDIGIHFIELWNHVMTDLAGDLHKNKDLLKPVSQKQRNSQHYVTLTPNDPNGPVLKPEEIKIEEEPPQREDTGPQERSASAWNAEQNPVRPVIPHRRSVHESSGAIQAYFEEDSAVDKAINIQALEGQKSEFKDALLSGIRNDKKQGCFKTIIGGKIEEDSPLKQGVPNQQTEKPLDFMSLLAARRQQEEEEEAKDRLSLQRKQNEGDETFATALLKPFVIGAVQESKNGTCNCQVIRSAGTWSHGLDESEHSIRNAYIEMIDQANHFIYIENQFFISNTAGKPVKNEIAQVIVERIKIAAQRNEKFRVIVVMPLLPAFEGNVDDPNAAVLRIQLYWEYMTISRGTASIYKQLEEDPHVQNPYDYIKFYALRNHDVLNNKPISEMIYVHSKLMIVDDDVVIMGSANINDRSMLGRCDSEIAMVIDDQDKVETKFGGQVYRCGKFAHTLRMDIFGEHSGADNDPRLIDPLSPEFNEVWDQRATNNTKHYRDVFRCYPDDQMRTIKSRGQFESEARPELYESVKDDIKGHLVEFPLHFLEDEDLRIKVFNMEYYVPDESFI